MIGRASLRDMLLPAFARTLKRPTHGEPDRLLVLQPDHLGDIILSEPAVRLLRDRRPNAILTAVVGPWSAGVARLVWPVDEVVTIDFPGFNRTEKRSNPLAPYARITHDAELLRAVRASDAIVLRDDAWWAAALAHASVPGAVVAGNDPRNRPFATLAVELDDDEHNTARATALVTAYLGIARDNQWDMSPSIHVSKDQIAMARELLDDVGVNGRYIVIHPGAGAPVKTWPTRYWRTVVHALADQQLVVTGSESEAGDCALIANALPHVQSLAGRTSLAALLGLFRGSALAIGTDNGPLHLAAAAGTPTLRLFGPSNPQRYGPPVGALQHRVIRAGWNCPRCEDLSSQRSSSCGCMLAISPAKVNAAIRTMLYDDA